MNRATAVAAALTAALVTAAPAAAATPESGKVSKSSPLVEWNGQAPGYGATVLNLFLADLGQAPACVPDTCDEFALEVADKDKLTVTGTKSGGFLQVEVETPDGASNWTYDAGEEDTVSVEIPSAAPGDYTVRVWTNDPQGIGGDYAATAQLGSGAAAAEAPAAPPAAAPQQQPEPQPAPAPAPAPEQQSPAPAPAPAASPAPVATLGAAARSVRAAARSLTLPLTSSAPMTKVVVKLARSGRTLASARLASLDGRGRVTLRSASTLRAGTYRVSLTGVDASGRTVTGGATLKVTR